MEIGLIILATMLASLLGWLLKQSFNVQPWVAAEVVDESSYQAPFNARPKVIALTALLAVVSSFFALIMSAYSLRMALGDWVPLTDPQLLWVNTTILVFASVFFQWARNGALNDRPSIVKPGLVMAGVLTVAFLTGQLIVWRQLVATGQTITGSPANSFFYLLTGAHGLHIMGGLYVWARATVKVMSGVGDEAVKQSVELCAIYWHFLLLVWLVIFGLMLST